ncbi:MAG TPA: hypothetical protein VJM49_22200, partial [Acidimicrobiales bacterium]|nr:hypothetical protein [Acidimicrobiales bacterium]
MEIVILLVVLAVVVVAGVAFVGLRARGGTDLEPPPARPVPPGGVVVEEPPTAAPGVAEAPAAPAVRPSFRDRLAKARGTLGGYLGSIRSRKVDAETW